MLKIDIRDCDKYLPYLKEGADAHSNLNKIELDVITNQYEEQDRELLQQNKFF